MGIRISIPGFSSAVAAAAAMLLLGACSASQPTIDTGPDAEVTFDGLHAIRHGAAAKAWARPDLDLSGYTKIMLQGAGVEFRPGGETSRMMYGRTDGPFALTEEQKARFREIAVETAREELGKSQRFTLVNEPGPDVLLIRAALIDVVSYVPPETVGARSDVFLRDLGEVTLVLELRDSVSDAILLRAVDRETVGRESQMTRANRPNNTMEVRRTFTRWMSQLRDRLDSFSGFATSGSQPGS